MKLNHDILSHYFSSYHKEDVGSIPYERPLFFSLSLFHPLSYLFTVTIEKYHQFQKYHKRLVEFAKERSFDPLDAENWYSITSQALVGSVKV